MRVNVIKREENELKIEIEGEDHTFCNALQTVLLEDEDVELAGYTIPHPLISNPVFYVRMKEKRKPVEALRKAAEKLISLNEELKQSFLKAVEEFASERQR